MAAHPAAEEQVMQSVAHLPRQVFSSALHLLRHAGVVQADSQVFRVAPQASPQVLAVSVQLLGGVQGGASAASSTPSFDPSEPSATPPSLLASLASIDDAVVKPSKSCVQATVSDATTTRIRG